MSSVGDDGLKKVNDLLLSSGHDVELPAHLGEAVVDMRAEVDEILSERVKTGGGGPAEFANFASEFTDVTVGSSGEYSSGRGILLGRLHPPFEIAYLLFEGADA